MLSKRPFAYVGLEPTRITVSDPGGPNQSSSAPALWRFGKDCFRRGLVIAGRSGECRFAQPYRPFRLGGRNWSSCPSAAIAGRPEQRRSRVALTPIVLFGGSGPRVPRNHGQIGTS